MWIGVHGLQLFATASDLSNRQERSVRPPERLGVESKRRQDCQSARSIAHHSLVTLSFFHAGYEALLVNELRYLQLIERKVRGRCGSHADV
jgi:hypothetical protein